ncbi:MAG: phosphate ABC transporter permease PstA [Thermotogae bacterium]|nr:phosphate ABC transporter permease PstA [Thermotogota bacterium]
MKSWRDRLIVILGLFLTFFALAVLGTLVIDVFLDALPRLNVKFLTSYPSRHPEHAGILPALVGSIWIGILTALISFPLGVATAIYLEEYAPKNFLTELLEINIANLAGVPSIIYGILGLELFVRALNLGKSVLAGSLILALLVLPMIVIASREAIRNVPYSIREAAYALGASKYQTVIYQVVPAAMPGILTGTILAMSRALGETAPLVMIGALTFVPFIPESVFDPFTVLPIQIFNWVSRPQKEFATNAAAAIVVLLFLTFSLNFIAIYLRGRYSKYSRND